MIEHYLSSNNEMCYNAKTQTFSLTKHTLKESRCEMEWMDFLPAAALLDENEARYKLVYMLFDITRIDDSDINF